MAVTLTVNTNSYISLTDADSYFNTRLHCSEWVTASADDKARALIMATKRIDALVYTGIKAVSTQALQFPRASYSNNESWYPSSNGDIVVMVHRPAGWVTETEVAQCVKDACCEEALALLKGIPKRAELQAQGVKSFSLGSLSESYTGAGVKLISSESLKLLSPYLAGTVPIC